eukprot:1101955-Prorocentrum_lima.AAC.1
MVFSGPLAVCSIVALYSRSPPALGRSVLLVCSTKFVTSCVPSRSLVLDLAAVVFCAVDDG